MHSAEWSLWLDFDQVNISNVPESPGMYKLHESMKILYIGSSNKNLRQSLFESLADPCRRKAKRFSYLITPTNGADSTDMIKEEVLRDYIQKHNGKLPLCM
jgi:hypothetical protein